jgi:hypothetical protein
MTANGNEKLRAFSQPKGSNIVGKVDLSRHRKHVEPLPPVDTRKPPQQRAQRDKIKTRPLHEVRGIRR